MKAAVATALLLLSTACASSLPLATLDADHALNGRIWQPATQSFITETAAQELLRAADYVLLGEKHDNSVHHRLQAEAVSDLVNAGRRPALAFEMINSAQGEALQKHLGDKSKTADALGAALDWRKSGWPDWRYYAPIATAALKAGLKIVPANFPRSKTREIGRKGFVALDPDLVERAHLNDPLPETLAKSLMQEMFISHCRMMPTKHLGPVAKIQRARDAVMADALTRHDNAVLIAGSGHTRRDRGVPYYLRQMKSDARIVSVAFVEVDRETMIPSDYAAIYNTDKLPFDLVRFTARYDTEDPCEKFKAQLQKMKKKKSE